MRVNSLAAALLGGQPLVSLLGNGQADSLSSGQGHPRLVALWTKQHISCTWFLHFHIDLIER